MKAYYKTILTGDLVHEYQKDPNAVYEYVLLEMTEACCLGMKQALEADAIGFGEFHDAILNQDHNINFADCRPYPEGAVWDEYPISYCPFCGAPVETEERERVSLKKVKRQVRQMIVDTEEVPIEK